MTFELRVYHATPGKISKLLDRFRNHTIDLFSKHGIESIAYWVDNDHPDDLIYVLKHTGDPVTNWREFGADEDWITAKTASEVDGRLVASIESRFMSPTDFSKIK